MPLTLFDKEMKLLSLNAIKTAQMTLFLVLKPLNAIDVVSHVYRLFSMIDGVIPELRYSQCIID